MVNSGWSKHGVTMHLMRCLSLFSAQFNVTMRGEYIPGKQNVAADALSRGNLPLSFNSSNCKEGSNPNLTRPKRGAGREAARLDVGALEEAVRLYFTMGLAPSTQRTYRSGKDRYIAFCDRAGVNPLPTTETVLCSFVTFLDALEDPFAKTPPMSRLEYVMRGIKKDEAAKSKGTRERLPITPEILRKIKAVWEPEGTQRDTKMLWAACCLCFFAFLRVGEMTCPTDASYDPTVHLSWSDIAIDNPRCPTVVRVAVKQSKTDPFRKGVALFVGRTVCSLCPVAALLDYMLVRGSAPGPLFQYRDGRLLTRARFSEAVRTALNKAGVDCAKYNTHSFRIGAATTAAAKGFEDSVIKTLGRWESAAYLQYVKIPREKLSRLSQQLLDE